MSLISLHDLRSRKAISNADYWMANGFELGSIGKAFLTIFEGLLHTSFGTQVCGPTWKI